LTARFAAGVNVAILLAALKATVPVTGDPALDRVNVVALTPVTTSLNVTLIALLEGTLIALFAGIVKTTAGGRLSMRPARFTVTGGRFNGVVTGKLTTADFVPFTPGAASEKFTVTVHVPLFAAIGPVVHVSGPMVKSAALAPVIAPAPKVAAARVLGFVIVMVAADTTAGFWAGKVTFEGEAVIPKTLP
jgi:hypothetical protein